MEAGTPETKAKMEPDNPDNVEEYSLEKEVKNFVVLQFEGSGGTAKLVANADYYPDASKIFDNTEQIRLLPSPKANIIAVVANTFGNIHTQKGMSLKEFLKRDYNRLYNNHSVFTKVTEENGDINEYLRMSGLTKVTSISTDMDPVEISLKRNVSKITIKVKNESAGNEKVTLNHVQLRDINAKYYYLANTEDIVTFTDDFSSADPYRFDSEPIDITDDGTEQTLTFYIPANLRGQTSSEAQYTKGLGAPEGATRFCLYGTYGSGANTTGINYTYYLGANLKNDFNLKPNYHYTYEIRIKSKGDARYDYRIEDCKEVKFKMDANCYMVQPPMGKDQSRIYAIPIRRAATFWHSATNGGVYGANQFDGLDYSNYAFNPNTKWRAEILWSDFQVDPSDFFDKDQGTGYDPSKSEQDPYFKIKVKNGMKGNVVVAVKLEEYESIVWSWHIWITDYDPDRENLVPDGIFSYGVENGHLHRYNNTIFNSGDYKDHGFVMDRNLGATGTAYEQMAGTMYYQFGRKDPFPGQTQDGQYGKFYKGGTALTNSTDADYIVKQNGTAQPGMKNVRYTINNPMKFIYTDNDASWTAADGIVSLTNPWYDPKYNNHDGTIMELKKSIYDPCPPGWKVPVKDVWDNISQSSWANGLYYKPNSSASVFFPAISYRPSTGSAVDEFETRLMGKEGKYWCATPSGTSAYALNIVSGSINVGTDKGTANAFPVRCVREGEYVRENYIAD